MKPMFAIAHEPCVLDVHAIDCPSQHVHVHVHVHLNHLVHTCRAFNTNKDKSGEPTGLGDWAKVRT